MFQHRIFSAVASAVLLIGCGSEAGRPASSPSHPPAASGQIQEFPIGWSTGHEGGGVHLPSHAPPAPHGSTHEIAIDPRSGELWVSGQNSDALMRMPAGGGTMRFAPMPPGSGPHGLAFDRDGRLWATLEYDGRIVRLDGSGAIAGGHDVRLRCVDCDEPLNIHPHGLGVGADGRTLWFTGKATGTVGRVAPDGEVRHWQLPTVGSVPIYIRLGPDGNMWVTELVGNAIARVTPEGGITEYPIPTHDSRPIAILPGPGDEPAMWFTEERGNKVGRIDLDCLARAEAAHRRTTPCIAEYPVPMRQPNVILAGLAFDAQGDLWVQQYVDPNRPQPEGADHIVRIARAGLAAGPAGLRPGHFTFYPVPTRRTVMHRIVAGPGAEMWFTEMAADRIGRIGTR